MLHGPCGSRNGPDEVFGRHSSWTDLSPDLTRKRMAILAVARSQRWSRTLRSTKRWTGVNKSTSQRFRRWQNGVM